VKNFANRSRIDKVIATVRVAPFFDARCITARPSEATVFLYHLHIIRYGAIISLQTNLVVQVEQ